MKKVTLLLLLIFASLRLSAQESKRPEINVSGFVDVYYGFDFNRPFTNERPDFLFNHSRHNEVNLNLGLIQMNLEGANYRGGLGLMVGTFPQYNMAAEQPLLQNVFEAYAGVALDQERKLWIDAGIFASHIGFESAISAENFTLTRSLLAENSPYFLSGAKLTYTPNTRWEFEVGVFNGWQRIQRPDGNTTPAFGSRITHTPSEKLTLNWSTFVGNDFPTEERRMRYFNNLYGIFQLSNRLDLILGFDFGFQEAAAENVAAERNMDTWIAPVGILRMELNERWAVALRGEYYQDKEGVIIESISPDGIRATGASFTLDRMITKNILFRMEARQLYNASPIFEQNNQLVRNNTHIIGSLAITIP
ncbi:hypothetical protein A3SI_13894 [Nitritalea halalkaliphila LW7]|uniref:Outer membrane protein n=1 Tax=Nitritalea halalkaliphila LW7 TaxID=1189621 RepID=I5C075_9BACT|nr:porin [Nitritalea halalkaliphila]EIM75227.1 hypothetical protein A3SI_13894 [Nitritalea halalkaliphila LW7]